MGSAFVPLVEVLDSPVSPLRRIRRWLDRREELEHRMALSLDQINQNFTQLNTTTMPALTAAVDRLAAAGPGITQSDLDAVASKVSNVHADVAAETARLNAIP